MEILRREAIYLWYYFSVQFKQIFSYWVLGMVIGSAISVFLKEHIHNAFRSLGETRLGVVGIWIASALGTVALFVRIISCYLCGVGAGLSIRAFCKDRQFFNFGDFEEPKNRDTDPSIFLRFLKNLGSNNRCATLCLRRRNDTASSGMDGGWHLHA